VTERDLGTMEGGGINVSVKKGEEGTRKRWDKGRGVYTKRKNYNCLDDWKKQGDWQGRNYDT